ncbi:MAG: glycosyltransferase [Lachnospiraceae bacterium]|nr:glycosyltransferase [Lachnospiraceae bacterium]
MPTVRTDIIVPVYNGAEYIKHFTEMFAEQTDEDVRLLFVDDGSTDDSPKLLREAEESGRPNIKVIRRENGGAAAARNTGLDASDAEYVAFFDIDDICAEDYVKTIKDQVSQGGFDILIYDRVMLYDDTKNISGNTACTAVDVSKEDMLKKALFDSEHFGGIHNILISKKYLDSNKLRFAEGYPYYEDFDFTYRCLALSEKTLYLKRTLYGYAVKHDASAMAKFSSDRLRCLELYEKLDKVIAKEAPGFADLFEKYAAARIYWSVLWQAALAAPSCRAFLKFAKQSHANIYMGMLKGYPEKKVRLLRRLFLFSKTLYYLTVRLLGDKYTAVERVPAEVLEESAEYCPDPGRILIYGMADRHAGLETYVMELFRNREGRKIDFLCDFKVMADSEEILAADSRIHYISAKGRHPLKHFFGVMKLLRAHPEYRTLYMNVVHASCAYTALAARLMGRRVVVHSHNSSGEYLGIHRMCRPLLNLISNGRVACSKEAAEYMYGRKAKDTLIVHYPINVKKYAYDEKVRETVRSELGLSKNFVICHVGRISAQKNPLFLTDILEEALKLRKDTVLLHIGYGDMEEEFDARIKQKGLESKLIRLGERNDVHRLMQAGDVFLLPSLYEGLPLVLLEAQSAGLPCVISDTISKESDVTENVFRHKLDEAASVWAATTVKASEVKRRDRSDELAAEGFVINWQNEVYVSLNKLLYKKGK